MPQASDHNARIAHAERIINAYGGVLARITPSVYGQPASLLPDDKDRIKQAIQVLIWELGDENEALREGLIQGYVLLAQFVVDHEAALLHRGQQIMASAEPTQEELKLADQAARIVNRIKLEMETLMEEITLFINRSSPPDINPGHGEEPLA